MLHYPRGERAFMQPEVRKLVKAPAAFRAVVQMRAMDPGVLLIVALLDERHVADFALVQRTSGDVLLPHVTHSQSPS